MLAKVTNVLKDIEHMIEIGLAEMIIWAEIITMDNFRGNETNDWNIIDRGDWITLFDKIWKETGSDLTMIYSCFDWC